MDPIRTKVVHHNCVTISSLRPLFRRHSKTKKMWMMNAVSPCFRAALQRSSGSLGALANKTLRILKKKVYIFVPASWLARVWFHGPFCENKKIGKLSLETHHHHTGSPDSLVHPRHCVSREGSTRRPSLRVEAILELCVEWNWPSSPTFHFGGRKAQGFILLLSNEVDVAEGRDREQVGDEATEGKRTEEVHRRGLLCRVGAILEPYVTRRPMPRHLGNATGHPMPGLDQPDL